MAKQFFRVLHRVKTYEIAVAGGPHSLASFELG